MGRVAAQPANRPATTVRRSSLDALVMVMRKPAAAFNSFADSGMYPNSKCATLPVSERLLVPSNRQTVADAGLQFGGVKRLRPRRHRIKGEHGGDHEERRQPRTNFESDVLHLFDKLHTRFCFCFLSSAAFPPNTR